MPLDYDDADDMDAAIRIAALAGKLDSLEAEAKAVADELRPMKGASEPIDALIARAELLSGKSADDDARRLSAIQDELSFMPLASTIDGEQRQYLVAQLRALREEVSHIDYDTGQWGLSSRRILERIDATLASYGAKSEGKSLMLTGIITALSAIGVGLTFDLLSAYDIPGALRQALDAVRAKIRDLTGPDYSATMQQAQEAERMIEQAIEQAENEPDVAKAAGAHLFYA